MKRLLHVALATLMAMSVATASAQLPSDGYTYRLQYAANGTVMTNADIATHDAALIRQDQTRLRARTCQELQRSLHAT